MLNILFFLSPWWHYLYCKKLCCRETCAYDLCCNVFQELMIGREIHNFLQNTALFRKWQNWDSSGWKTSLLLLGPAFSLVVSSSAEKVQQSLPLLLKVRPFNLDFIIQVFFIIVNSFFWMWPKNVVRDDVFIKVLFFLIGFAHFFFFFLVSPQSQKLSYAAAALQAGSSSTVPAQAPSSSTGSNQVLILTV